MSGSPGYSTSLERPGRRAPEGGGLAMEVAASLASSWLEGSSSNDYPGYDKIIEQLAKETADTQIEKSAALVGSPEKLIDQIKTYQDSTGGFDIASLQVSFSDLPLQVAEDSMRLFAEEVIPYV